MQKTTEQIFEEHQVDPQEDGLHIGSLGGEVIPMPPPGVDIGTFVDSVVKAKKRMPSTIAASKSEFDRNAPDYTKPQNFEPATMALDAGIGIEKMLGLDPMKPVRSIPSALLGMGKGILDIAMTPGTKIPEKLAPIITTPLNNIRQGASGGDAQQFMEGVGQVYGTGRPLAKPAVSAARTGASAGMEAAGLTSENLAVKAAANRIPVPPSGTGISDFVAPVAGAGLDYLMGGGHSMAGAAIGEGANILRKAARQPIRNAMAAIQEGMAKSLSRNDVSKYGPAPAQTVVRPEAAQGPIESVVSRGPENVPPVSAERIPFKDEGPVGIQRPQPNYRPPPDEPGPFFNNMREPASPAAPIEMTETAEATTMPKVDIQAVERIIKPSGEIAKRSTLRNAPALIQEVPELATMKPGLQADAALVEGLRRTEEGVAQAENVIPRETTVPKKPLMDKLTELWAEYADNPNMSQTAAKLEKLAKKWDALPDIIPWEQFRDAKRAFFREENIKSGPMRRAYGIMMDSASEVSGELAKANKSYSVVRRAIDDAKIDIKTGRRVMDVAKPVTSPKIETTKPLRGGPI